MSLTRYHCAIQQRQSCLVLHRADSALEFYDYDKVFKSFQFYLNKMSIPYIQVFHIRENREKGYLSSHFRHCSLSMFNVVLVFPIKPRILLVPLYLDSNIFGIYSIPFGYHILLLHILLLITT